MSPFQLRERRKWGRGCKKGSFRSLTQHLHGRMRDVTYQLDPLPSVLLVKKKRDGCWVDA